MDGIIQVIRVDAIKADNSGIFFKGSGLLEGSAVRDTIIDTLRQSEKLLIGGIITDIVSENNEVLIDGKYNITLHLKTTPDLKNTIYGYGIIDDNARITEHSTTFFGAHIEFNRNSKTIMAKIVGRDNKNEMLDL